MESSNNNYDLDRCRMIAFHAEEEREHLSNADLP
jgi:hypothetical protein